MLDQVGPALLQILLGGLVVNLVVNSVSNKWQRRNNEYEFIRAAAERSIDELESLISDITRFSSMRVQVTRNFLNSISAGDQDYILSTLSDYRRMLTEWNAALGQMTIKLTLLVDLAYAKKLEDNIHADLRKIGQDVEKCYNNNINGDKPGREVILTIKDNIDIANGTIRIFIRDLSNEVIRKKKWIYEGRLWRYDLEGIKFFTTLDLFKALFETNVKSLGISRPATHLIFPDHIRDSRSWVH